MRYRGLAVNDLSRDFYGREELAHSNNGAMARHVLRRNRRQSRRPIRKAKAFAPSERETGAISLTLGAATRVRIRRSAALRRKLGPGKPDGSSSSDVYML